MLAVPGAGAAAAGAGADGGVGSNGANFETNPVKRNRERHIIVPLEDWVDNSPPSLFDICTKYILHNLTRTLCRLKQPSPPATADNSTSAATTTTSLTLELRPGIVSCIDSRTTDSLLQYYLYNRLNDNFHIVPAFAPPAQRHLLDRAVLSLFIESHSRFHLSYADLEEVCEREPKLMLELLKCSPQLKFLTISAKKLIPSDFSAALRQTQARLRAISFANLNGAFYEYCNPTSTSSSGSGTLPPDFPTRIVFANDVVVTSYLPRTCKALQSVQYLTIMASHEELVQRDACGIVGAFDNLRQLEIISANSLRGFHLTRFQQTLQVLDLHDCKLEASDFNDTLCTLHELRVLDVSQPETLLTIDANCLKLLNEKLPKLSELDISNTSLCDRVHGTDVLDETNCVRSSIDGLKGRATMLNFLGLLQCRGNPCALPYLPAKRVTGDASEAQVLGSLERYMRRSKFIHRALNDLYRFLRHDPSTKPFYTLKLILDAMLIHAKTMRIQIAASAALFYVIKNDLRTMLPLKVKRQVLRTLIDAMQNHSKENTMLRNGCLTLCQFQIPEDVMFIYEDVVHVLLVMIQQPGIEEFLMRIAVLLLNSLACQVENEHKLLLGKLGTVETMLDIIRGSLNRPPSELTEQQREIMDVAWSILWNVTDETPENCRKFFDKKGMMYFLECRQKYPENAELLRNIMGLLGNVAEVPELRAKLVHEPYLKVFSELLESESDGIEVSYNACGVLAHICSDGPSAWTAAAPSRPAVLEKMIFHINRWSLKSKRNINYRSFEPILRLVPCEQSTASQHWACWALANLTRVLPNKYCELLEREGGVEKLNAIVGNSTVRRDTLRYATLALRHMDNFKKNISETLWDIDTDTVGPHDTSSGGGSGSDAWVSSPAYLSNNFQQQNQQQQNNDDNNNNNLSAAALAVAAGNINNNSYADMQIPAAVAAVAAALYQAVDWAAANQPPPHLPPLQLPHAIDVVDILPPPPPMPGAFVPPDNNNNDNFVDDGDENDDDDDDDDDDVEMQLILENIIQQGHQMQQEEEEEEAAAAANAAAIAAGGDVVQVNNSLMVDESDSDDDMQEIDGGAAEIEEQVVDVGAAAAAADGALQIVDFNHQHQHELQPDEPE